MPHRKPRNARAVPEQVGFKSSLEESVSHIKPGHMALCRIPIAVLPTQSEISLSLAVLKGAQPGPSVWLSAAIHGDELNGIDIIRKLITQIDPSTLHGTIYAIPIVNAFGFLNGSRYLPDRRDLNRSFPGSRNGSLASRLAYTLMKEVIVKCDYGIDFHTASVGHANTPQIRGDLEDPATLAAAKAFGAPVLINSRIRDGSLRQAALKKGGRVLLFEGGEALKFENDVIASGIKGTLSVLRHLEMIPQAEEDESSLTSTHAIGRSYWIRAKQSGIFRQKVQLLDHVDLHQTLGEIGDEFNIKIDAVKANESGIVIGLCTNPAVNEGDALVHIGVIAKDQVH